MADEEKRAGIKERLDRGEWLLPAQVAILLDISRSTVQRLIDTGDIPYRLKAGTKYRTCDPEVVRRLLAAHEQVRRGTAPSRSKTKKTPTQKALERIDALNLSDDDARARALREHVERLDPPKAG